MDNSIADQPPKPLVRSSTTFYQRITTDWWWWELASWLVSFACVSTIVGLLLHYDGKVQPDYVVKGITLNAGIAVFSTVAKAALILPVSEAIGQLKWVWMQEERKLFDFLAFDNASRGPLGSLLLLSTTKCRGLVSVAAAITICALAFEPFFQQSVSYPSRDVISGNSTVSIANSYGPNINDMSYPVATDFRWMNVGGDSGAIRSAALEVANALAERDKPVRSAPARCTTGRCTWAPYSSLAVCHTCQNMSHLLVPHCQRAELNRPDGTSGATNPCGHRLNTTLMTGIWGNAREAYMGLSTVVVGDFVPSSSGYFKWNSTAFRNASHPLLDFYIGFVPGGYPGILRNETPVLLECLFQWCVKTFESSYQEGRLHERTLATYLPPDKSEVSDTPEGTLLRSAPNEAFVMLAGSKAFRVGANLTRRIRNSLNANMPVYLTNSSLDTTGQYPGRWNFVQNSPYDVGSTLGSMAEAVTNYMRTSTNEGTEQHEGQAWTAQPFVEVQWLWLILPGVLLFGTLALIGATIFRSKQHKVPAWKSSALATLLHGLTEESREKIHVDASQSEVEALSSKVHVVMSSNRRLVPAESRFEPSSGGGSMSMM
ncbi:hypothetical protein DE146DRAFT_332961 [Phaeosphaeria sp. MPI-PUGE-AT-0046c]|nr:hypothetical protein DE146DRAFT_332961 [Phaeosphaeria sp. MPI-PUGE-AT-0046c]